MTPSTLEHPRTLQALERIRRLPCWRGEPEAVEALAGGITNQNYRVSADGATYVVRLGGNIPANHVMRFNEHAASQAAADLGLSPSVRYAEDDVLVIDYLPSRTLKPHQIGDHLPGILSLLRRTHAGMASRLRGPALSYWLFHVIQDNLHTLREHRFDADLDTLERQARQLERAVGPVDLRYCHNDLLAANILDDGERLWLIDWDYAGFNSPLADLGSLASNNHLSTEQEHWLLEHYDECPPSPARWRAYLAMKTASSLKETLWSMTSECISSIDFDYAAYSRTNLAGFNRAWEEFLQS
ncbi:choline/ethanolamine kinase family protein [Burkholderia paludis]|uniref:choline/ethanolamine kinase family protein n=1 Tax=Burkholderia paludis TaxID=1506587 RepID=UPI00068E6FCD|nr:choline/ethanolamine kinase family protein [Burkholderia paludis]